MNIRLSVVVPCYNERERIKEGFGHFYSFLKKQKYSWELIFVNDGSIDSTLFFLGKLKGNDERIKILSYRENKGKGYAIAYGVSNAKGKYILFSDLDHSVDIKTINNFLVYLNDYKVVIGSRRVEGSKFTKKQNIIRETLGRGFTFLVKVLIDHKIKDATCGFKVFEKVVAKKIFSKLLVFDWAFDAELLYLCKINKINYFQAPVIWKDVTGSKVSLKKDILRSLAGLARIRLNDFLRKYK